MALSGGGQVDPDLSLVLAEPGSYASLVINKHGTDAGAQSTAAHEFASHAAGTTRSLYTGVIDQFPSHNEI